MWSILVILGIFCTFVQCSDDYYISINENHKYVEKTSVTPSTKIIRKESLLIGCLQNTFTRGTVVNFKNDTCEIFQENNKTRGSGQVKADGWVTAAIVPKPLKNVARLPEIKHRMSSKYNNRTDSSRMMDGNFGSCAATAVENNPWLLIDLQRFYPVEKIVVYQSFKGTPSPGIYISTSPGYLFNPMKSPAVYNTTVKDAPAISLRSLSVDPAEGGDFRQTFSLHDPVATCMLNGFKGKEVSITAIGANEQLVICEVQIFVYMF